MEFPISFFLDYAWNPDKIDAADIKSYTEKWCAAPFGKEHAVEIADILLNMQSITEGVKPELLNENTYSDNYGECGAVSMLMIRLLERAEKINVLLPDEYKDAYFQTCVHPVKSMCQLSRTLYFNVARTNILYAKKMAEPTNNFTDK